MTERWAFFRFLLVGPLTFIALGTMQGKTPAQLDAFFNTYGAA